MAGKLFSLFDDKLHDPQNLVAGDAQNLQDLAQSEDDQDLILRKIKQFETVKPKVDYSDFSNFVFFNSALDYFNITGELILNQYPYDGSAAGVQAFLDDLDDYQQYVVQEWPKAQGYLKFDPSVPTYVKINDLGTDSGVNRTGFFSPSSGSWSIEFWCIPPATLTGSNDVAIISQVTGSVGGCTVFFSGSSVNFQVVSGTNTSVVSAPFDAEQTTFYSFVLDRNSSPTLLAFSGSQQKFPVLVSSASANVSGDLNFGATSFYIASGSLPGKNVLSFSGSLDEIRVWNSARDVTGLSSSFNTKLLAQDGLIALWRFNETALTSSGDFSVPASQNATILDSSGHKLHGTILNYLSSVRVSGTLVPYETSDLVLNFNAAEVRDFVSAQQSSGTDFDRTNDNLITRLVPSKFLELEQDAGTSVLRNFLFVLARQFDYLKVRIDQFGKMLRVNYGQFDQTPDALLADVGKFFGWEFTGNFLNASAFQYLLGKEVLANIQSNKELDVKLFEIKNEFWKRTLLNLMYIYKTKGTRESIESLLRVYGVSTNFIRLKEYGLQPAVGISTNRISSQKSVPVFALGSGSTTTTSRVVTSPFSSSAQTVECLVRFPTANTGDMQSSISTGSIWTLNTSGSFERLYWSRDPNSTTGSLFATGTFGSVSLQSVPTFDDGWYHISVLKNVQSGSVVLDVRGGNLHLTASQNAILTLSEKSRTLWIGSSGTVQSQCWGQEFRVWDRCLNDEELEDHTLNFQSYGSSSPDGISDINVHLRLNENFSADALGNVVGIVDLSSNKLSVQGYGLVPSAPAYKKFLIDYSYIAPPDFGWNENKIRSISATRVPLKDSFNENPLLALEFNLMDALNEDISQILAGLDEFNNFIGNPANRFRDSYNDLDTLRKSYFNRLTGQINFTVFFDMLEFFDRSFIDLIRKLLPARANFLGEELIVESHMLERPKLQWNYRRQEVPFQPEGVIKILVR